MFSGLTKAKKRIIDVFLDLLYEKDFRKISVTDILEEADISKGTFYKYFTDKYDLSKQAIENYFLGMEQEILYTDVSLYPNKFIAYYNATRFDYMAIRKIKDIHFDGSEFLKDRIYHSYLERKHCNDVEADYFASQFLWTLDHLASLKKNITKEDLDSLFFSYRKVMALASL